MDTNFWLPTQHKGYEVSSCGKIRSIDRTILRSDGQTRRIKGVELIPKVDNCGYLRVGVSVANKQSTVKVHRVVAIAFIPNPDNLPQVNHKNGIKTDNRVENLEWTDNAGNQQHAYATGLSVVRTAQEAPRFTGSVKVFDKQGNYLYTVSGNLEMQAKGLDFRLVSACLMGKRKSHKGCTFRKEFK